MLYLELLTLALRQEVSSILYFVPIPTKININMNHECEFRGVHNGGGGTQFFNTDWSLLPEQKPRFKISACKQS